MFAAVYDNQLSLYDNPNLYDNQLSSIPDSLGSLTALTSLCVAREPLNARTHISSVQR